MKQRLRRQRQSSTSANEHPDLIASDHIRERITELFNGRVGEKLDEKRLASIYDQGLKRYEQKIPPGYKDTEKGGTRQFGDLVIWTEILEHAKSTKQPIVFITSDTKEDWWWKHGQFTVGPRPELVQEIKAVADTKFYMYNVERFLSEAQTRVDTKVEPTEVNKAAKEFREIEEKRKIKVPIEFLKELEISTGRADELRDKLKRLSSSQWPKTPVIDFLGGVQTVLGRPLDLEEKQYLFELILNQRKTMDSIAEGMATCWEIVEFLAFIVDVRSRRTPSAPTP